MQQSSRPVCLHSAWRTTALRVGGLAARPSCPAGLRRGGSDRPTHSDADPTQNAPV